jgi:hypothetical protein
MIDRWWDHLDNLQAIRDNKIHRMGFENGH